MDKITTIKGIIVYDDDASRLRQKYGESGKKQILSWSEFLELSQGNDKKFLKLELKKRIQAIRPSRCCNIVYTSGTTGNPKGVMLSHDSMLYNTHKSVENLVKNVDWRLDGSERIVSYLPMSHSAA